VAATNMTIDYEQIVGKILFENEALKIGQNGVSYHEDYIAWEDAELIYVGGTKRSINGIPTSEDRTITLENTTLNSRIDISLSSAFRMGKEKKDLFGEIYSLILSKTSERQWTQFLQNIRTGTRLVFNEFELTKDAFYLHQLFGGYKQIDTDCVKECSLSQGHFYIHYQEPTKKLKRKNAGQVAHIPNIHIVQAFIRMIANNH
jgi:hypothetical protein